MFTVEPATTVEEEEVPEEPGEGADEDDDGLEGAAGVATWTVDVAADGS
ncbi:hypothetical protein [Streptomyces sp. NPDC050287]